MSVKPVVRFSDESFIEPLLAASGFVACNKEDGLAFRVEGESDAPLTIRRTKAQLFHICVTGIVQSIDARTPQLRPELLQEPGVGKDLGSYVFRQFLKLRFQLVADFDVPSHELIMAFKTYGVKTISDPALCHSIEGFC
jgi:hypothetical protein